MITIMPVLIQCPPPAGQVSPTSACHYTRTLQPRVKRPHFTDDEVEQGCLGLGPQYALLPLRAAQQEGGTQSWSRQNSRF